jgi:uncharacterized protein YcbX
VADLVARIAALWRYPVKSCAGEAVDRLALGPDGWPDGDRAWGVVDATGELTWMGAHPRLALVQARRADSGLVLHALGEQVAVPADGGDERPVRAWNGERQAFDDLKAWRGPAAADALLQAVTGAELQLVRLSPAAQRRPVLNALHVVGDGSLQAWQDALPGRLIHPVERVRPNLVLTAADGGPLTPFIEDLLTEVRLGALTLHRTGPCVRCVMTSIDPASGEAQPPALDALTRLSAERLPGEPVQFGVYAAGSGAGELRVGDEIELTLSF